MTLKILCIHCGRHFIVWDIHEKIIKCPHCDAEGKNPYYVPPKKVDPEKVFVRFDEEE